MACPPGPAPPEPTTRPPKSQAVYVSAPRAWRANCAKSPTPASRRANSSAISTLERHGRLTLGALAEYERVAPPSITKMIAKLEAADLVARTLDANDRRVAWVTLTPTGERHLTQIRQRKNVWLAARLAELSDDERRRISDALDALDLLTADRR